MTRPKIAKQTNGNTCFYYSPGHVFETPHGHHPPRASDIVTFSAHLRHRSLCYYPYVAILPRLLQAGPPLFVEKTSLTAPLDTPHLKASRQAPSIDKFCLIL